MKILLETERLILRELEIGDISKIHKYSIDEEVIKYVDFGPNTEEETRDFVNMSIGYQKEKPRLDYELAIIEKLTGDFMGVGGIHISNGKNREGWIGYVLDKPYWRKGYGKELARRLLKFGFNDLNLHRIYGTCEPSNLGSRGVLEGIGMTYEGHSKENIYHRARWRDTLTFAILEDDFVSFN